jgi:hypothetical protein
VITPIRPTPLYVYLCYPITGTDPLQAYNGAQWMANELWKRSSGQVRGINPLRYSINFYNAEAQRFEENALTTDEFVMLRCKADVQRSHLVIARLQNATKATIGGCFEMAWAHLLDKPLVVAMDAENIHQHPFVRQSAISIVGNDEEAIKVALCILLVEEGE